MSSDGKTVTLNTALKYAHQGESLYGVDMRAEAHCSLRTVSDYYILYSLNRLAR